MLLCLGFIFTLRKLLLQQRFYHETRHNNTIYANNLYIYTILTIQTVSFIRYINVHIKEKAHIKSFKVEIF